MTEKRMSTRNRGEPPAKKRALTPPPPPQPPPPSRKQAEPEEEDEELPSKPSEGLPLPVLHERQQISIASKAYKSISESGVLSASIEKSRQQWMVDGVFERFWEKPSKKRPVTGKTNPAKESMSKLGPCTMMIEPHVFDITLYTVKDYPPPPKQAPYQPPPPSTHNTFSQGASYQPPVYTGPFMGTHNSDGHSTTNGPQSGPPTLPRFNETFGGVAPPPHTPAQALPYPPHPARPPPLDPRRSSHDGYPQSPERKPDPQSDPVIQILATRAASDYGLKSLMKVVASGKASPDQLKEFQGHIDEINSTLKSKFTPETPPMTLQPSAQPPYTSTAAQPPPILHPGHQSTLQRRQNPHYPPPAPPPHQRPYTHSDVYIKTEPVQHHYYQPIPPPPPKPRPYAPPKPEIQSIVFDFGGTGDRFSFPRLSILDYVLNGTEVLMSFLVIRRGNTTVAAGYKDSKNYYQPVTIRLSCPNARTLEPLSRIVAPLQEVKDYMESTFDNMLPAKQVYLATRLPKEDAEDLEDEGADEDVTVGRDTERKVEVKTFYEAPNSLVPMVA